MADESQDQQAATNARKRFNRTYFWGMVIALIVIMAIYYILAFSRQSHSGHGQAAPESSMVMQAGRTAA